MPASNRRENIIFEEKNGRQKIVGMVGCSAGTFEQWPVVGMVMVFRPKSFVCVWTII